MNETTKVVRITKAQRFDDIKALLMGETPTNGTDIEKALSFIDSEIDLLKRKNSSENKKQTDLQKANEHYCELIVEYLATLDPDSNGKTCTEINRAVVELNPYGNQKVSRLCGMLEKAGRIKKGTWKSKTVYTLA